MATTIQLRRDTAANWTSNDPVLLAGETGVELDTNKLKIGNGVSAWSLLDYLVAGGGGGGVTIDQPTNTTPSDAATGVVNPPTFTSSVATGTDVHIHSIWTVYSDAGGVTEVYNSKVVTDTISHQVPNGALEGGIQYWFSVQYIGVASISTPSALTSFTAIDPFILPQTDLHTGTSAIQDIVTGIDFIANDGLVWTKSRTQSNAFHILTDTVRGVNLGLSTNANAANIQGATAFNADGFRYGNDGNANNSGDSYVNWQFIKQQGIFDIITWTGNAATNNPQPIDLEDGLAVFGMALIKSTFLSSFWVVQHRSLNTTGGEFAKMNTEIPDIDATNFNNVAATTTSLHLGSNGNVNSNGSSFVAYVFAHNPTKGIICDEYIGTGGLGNKITTGFPIGFLMIKSSNQVGGWRIYDNVRDPVNPNTLRLFADDVSAETGVIGVEFNSDGFTLLGTTDDNASGGAFLYMAIADPAQFP